MSELTRLISRLNKAILTESSYLDSIRYPELLVESLEELNNLIGNERVKDAVATQVSYLIAVKDSQASEISEVSSPKEDQLMLNTILYGSPGVGKTLVGTKLAKIWYSLGFLDGSRRKIALTPELEREQEIKEIMNTFDKIKEEKGFKPDEQLEEMVDMVKYIVIATTLLSIALSFYKSYGTYWAVIITTIIIVAFIVTYYEDKDDPETTEEQKEMEEAQEEDETGIMPPDEDIITVVSRADFVGKYVGWSDKKTLKLLNDNLGKVLFVDEAYSLVTNGRDTFGIEVLNTINLFLSEHPGEIIVIFAGYKDLMKTGIFSFQPGLSRRFMWHFECDGYSHQELFKIFNIQLEKTGWGLTDYRETKRLFRKYKESFPNFGGDTERLAFFAKLEHSREYIDDEYSTPNKMLTPTHIRRGIRVLKKNNIKNTSPQPRLSNMIEQLANL